MGGKRGENRGGKCWRIHKTRGSKSAMLQKYNPYPCDGRKKRKRKKEPKTKNTPDDAK